VGVVSFTIPGKITSANRVTRHVGKVALKSKSARDDDARIKGWALLAYAMGPNGNSVAVKMPVRAEVRIEAINSRLDADNLPKTILDGIKGILIVNDSPKHLGRLIVEHKRDKLGERYVVTVDEMP